MGQRVRQTNGGLRERKKQRTRAMLVDAAVQLCLEHGYDNTTVEQIAAAADVSSRTFSRYFPTKEAVVVAVIEDLANAAAAELATIPRSVPPLPAIARAHADVLRRVPSGGVAGLTTQQLVLMVNVLGHRRRVARRRPTTSGRGPSSSIRPAGSALIRATTA